MMVSSQTHGFGLWREMRVKGMYLDIIFVDMPVEPMEVDKIHDNL